MVARQRCLLERTALGFVVAQEMASVLRTHRLQGSVELKRFDGCGSTNGAVGSALFPDSLTLTLGHRLRFRHWHGELCSRLHWFLLFRLVLGRRIGVVRLSEVD